MISKQCPSEHTASTIYIVGGDGGLKDLFFSLLLGDVIQFD